MTGSGQIIKHRDATGVVVQFSRNQIESLMDTLPPEHRQFARALAETIVAPQEIWQAWARDENNQGQWRKVRSYLRLLDLTHLDIGAPFGATVVKFAYSAAWELASVGILLGTYDDVADQMETIRSGSIEYSIQRQ